MLPKADAWIAIGTTFSQTTTGAWNLEKASQVIHIDIDPNQIGKIFQPSLGINADAKVVLRQLIDRVERDGLGRSTDPAKLEIGRAACRGRGCQYVEVSGVAVPLKKNT